jgi:hypothetical protein
LITSKKRGSNALFCNEVRVCILRTASHHTATSYAVIFLQLKLLHMMAGMRMSWEAQAMHVVVAKVVSGNCALGRYSPSG